MTSVDDIIRFTYCGNLFNKQVCNVFFYSVGLWTGNLNLADAAGVFGLEFYTAFSGILSANHKFIEVTADNLTNEIETATDPFVPGTQGQDQGESLGRFAAIPFKLNVASKLTRNGYKRFAGMTEPQQIDGLFTQQFLNNTVTPINFLGGNLELTNDDVLSPVIVGRNPDGSYDFSRVQPVVSVGVPAQYTTQNSRKG